MMIKENKKESDKQVSKAFLFQTTTKKRTIRRHVHFDHSYTMYIRRIEKMTDGNFVVLKL